MKIVHRGLLNNIQFVLAVGDLFAADVDAIVSSEQTDFILSADPASISGQIRYRYGDTIQQELDATTSGQVLHAGTIIWTSGGADFTRIFHAGFHDPSDWRGSHGSSTQDADYFEAIGSCIRQVLHEAKAQKLSSIAFPLIGCGRFGLDEKMLILQFFDAIDAFDSHLKDGEHLNVWLVIHNHDQFESAVGAFVDLLLSSRRKMVALQMTPTGVPILDR